MKLKLFLLLSLIVCAAACQKDDPNAPMNPDMAKSMIKLRGLTADETGLFQAVKLNDVPLIKAFFDAGVSPDATNQAGETILSFAVKNSETKTVKEVMQKANLSLTDKKGDSPLYLALSNDKKDVFNALLEKGADVNAVGTNGKTTGQSVLYLSLIKGDEELFNKLLAKGADPNKADNFGAVPLSEVCIGTRANPELVKALLDKGANPNAKENAGGTPLLFIASNTQTTGAKRLEIVKALLDKGADKKVKDKSGKTPLAWAQSSGNKELIELLK